LGISLKEKNEMESAFSSFVKAIKINPNFIQPLHNLASIINNVHFRTNRPDLHEIMIMILERNNCIDPNEISGSIINLLKLDPILKKFFNNYFSFILVNYDSFFLKKFFIRVKVMKYLFLFFKFFIDKS